MPENTASPRPPLTAGAIARRLRRSRPGVKKSLVRLGIQPATTLGGIAYYPAEAVAKVKKDLRPLPTPSEI